MEELKSVSGEEWKQVLKRLNSNEDFKIWKEGAVVPLIRQLKEGVFLSNEWPEVALRSRIDTVTWLTGLFISIFEQAEEDWNSRDIVP